jgi:hypothetical protein
LHIVAFLLSLYLMISIFEMLPQSVATVLLRAKPTRYPYGPSGQRPLGVKAYLYGMAFLHTSVSPDLSWPRGFPRECDVCVYSLEDPFL